MTPLRVISPDLTEFATEKRPLRPSRVASFLLCPMRVVLDPDEECAKPAADTGSLVHEAARVFHTTTEADRVAAGQAALLAARDKFPHGDAERASEIFRAYSADQKNRDAVVVWCEQPVRLVLPADPGDPTGQPVVIAGTLDQVRRIGETLSVWDIKTGTYHSAHDSLFEYLTQQAVYTLAAIETLDPSILPGGLICTGGYSRTRGAVHVDNVFTVEQARDLVLAVPPFVAAIRRGEALFRPGLEACKFCDVKKAGYAWPKCHQRYKGLYS